MGGGDQGPGGEDALGIGHEAGDQGPGVGRVDDVLTGGLGRAER
jgi:hypothetical protein